MATNVETQTYNVMCFNKPIKTTVTNDPRKVTEWITRLESSIPPNPLLVFGLDVEWRPHFASGHKNPIAIIQLSSDDCCLIFQIIHSRHVPGSLVELLLNPAYTFVGVGVKSDVEKLEKDYGFGIETNVVDLCDVAVHRYGVKALKNYGLKNLCNYVLGKEMEKPFSVTMSAWDNNRLTVEQVKYACYDAFVSYEIGAKLRADRLDCKLNMWGFPNVATCGIVTTHPF